MKTWQWSQLSDKYEFYTIFENKYLKRRLKIVLLSNFIFVL